MRTPGILPSSLVIAPIRRVLPSRFVRLEACALRETLASGGQAALLPSPPGSALGTIAHKLLEKAGRGEFATWTKEAIYEEWDRMVAAAEEQMATLWLERHLVPLRKTYRHYAVRRIQACERAATIAASIADTKRIGGSGGTPGRECEAWVQTADGLVGGFVDEIERSTRGVILRDYKSGSLEEPAENGEQPRVKESYRAQMMLYAAIIQEVEGVWPERVELESLGSKAVSVLPLEPSECLDLLAKAKELLASTNQKVAAAISNPAAGLKSLATPRPPTCQYCEYRASCEAYWDARESNAEGWPHDVRGTVRKITILGIGTVLIDVESVDGNGQTVRVRGLDPARHPALETISEGNQVVICNLRPEGTAGVLTQTQLTTVYQDTLGEPVERCLRIETGG